jgi:hypothetical protein
MSIESFRDAYRQRASQGSAYWSGPQGLLCPAPRHSQQRKCVKNYIR